MSAWQFVVKNKDTILSVFSIIVAIWGVRYGKKAYFVAKQIFNEGIQLDKNKVLQCLSLEFVTDFFIPFAEFKTRTKDIRQLNADYSAILVTVVKDNLKFEMNPASFLYFYNNKGDVWNAVDNLKGMSQTEAFNGIMDFIDDAKLFKKYVEELRELMNGYLADKDHPENKNKTFQQFLDEKNNNRKFKDGLQLVDRLTAHEKNLPKELRISEMTQKLHRNS